MRAGPAPVSPGSIEAPSGLHPQRRQVLEITSKVATRETDGYNGVKLYLDVQVERHKATVSIDVGFGDVMEPRPVKARLAPFLDGDPPPQVMAYALYTNIAEKVHGPIGNLPDFAHRLKDVLDVVLVGRAMHLHGAQLLRSVAATFDRRGTPPRSADFARVLRTMGNKEYRSRWATTLKDRRVTDAPDLAEALRIYEALVGPVLSAVESGEDFAESWRDGVWTDTRD